MQRRYRNHNGRNDRFCKDKPEISLGLGAILACLASRAAFSGTNHITTPTFQTVNNGGSSGT